jgi:hypothetical protein
MNVANVVGKTTEQYKAEQSKLNNKHKQVDRRKQKMATTIASKLDKKTANKKTAKATTEAKTVQRTINGQIVKLTPTENFIDRAAYRLNMLRAQFEQLGKQVGPQYEKTDEMVKAIETQIIKMADAALAELRKPARSNGRAAKPDNPYVKILQSC